MLGWATPFAHVTRMRLVEPSPSPKVTRTRRGPVLSMFAS
jgi:hypothetical protein